jgi:hypothetical protein
MKPLLPGITLLCLLLVGASPAQGRVFRTDSHITAISKERISVKVGHAKHSYKITSQTLIELDGRKVGPKALRKGMHADVTASQIDRNTAIAIEASSGS